MAKNTLSTPPQQRTILPSAYRVEQLSQQCYICQETLGLPRPDGECEEAHLLPCSHIFGHLCIARWLESSPNHNCPTCRRSMIYKSCGHLIRPYKLSHVPSQISPSSVPEKCLLCRQEEGLWKERLDLIVQHQQSEERVLEGLKVFLPSLYGGMSVSTTVASAEARIEESKDRLRKRIECLREELEKDQELLAW